MSEEAKVVLPERDEGTVARVSSFKIKKHRFTAYKVRLSGERGEYKFRLPLEDEVIARRLNRGDHFRMEVPEDVIEEKPKRYINARRFIFGGDEAGIIIDNNLFVFNPRIHEGGRATSDVVK